VSYNNTHGQLRRLIADIYDPLVQNFGVVFIGDSITWGIGATGTSATDPRDGTLSDPRDYATTPSYVNQVKAAIGVMLGNGVTTTHSNWPASPSGQAITTHTKQINLYPRGARYEFVIHGVCTVVDTADANALCNQKQIISINPGVDNYVELTFPFTGDGFDMVFGCLGNGGKYYVIADGVEYGPYSTRDGDDGYTGGYSRVRTHTFPYMTDGTIVIKAVHYDNVSGGNGVYIEAIRVTKTVRITNQGISGATAKSYFTYNMPASNLTGPTPVIPSAWAGLTVAATGTTSVLERVASGSITGYQTIYAMTSSATLSITLPVAADKELLRVYFSSIPNSVDVRVKVSGNVVGTFVTSSLAPNGPTYGYQRQAEVSMPAGTTSVTLEFVYTNYTGVTPAPNSSLYVEGFANYTAAELHYPTSNGFGDGVALDDKDRTAFIQLGTNDRIDASTVATSITTTRYYLEKILSVLPAACHPVLMLAPPAVVDGPPTMWGGMNDIAYAVRSLAISAGVDYIDNNTIFDGIDPDDYLADGLHPNDVGYTAMSNNIITAVKTA
jgi:lysophospholipase L1-like esterase